MADIYLFMVDQLVLFFFYFQNWGIELCAFKGFPGGSEGKASACNAGDLGLIPGSGRSPGEGNGNPLQYSCLENPKNGGTWWATVHGVSKSRLSDFTFKVYNIIIWLTYFMKGWPWNLLFSGHSSSHADTKLKKKNFSCHENP